MSNRLQTPRSTMIIAERRSFGAREIARLTNPAGSAFRPSFQERKTMKPHFNPTSIRSALRSLAPAVLLITFAKQAVYPDLSQTYPA